MREVWPGDPYPLGATWDGTGTNFALFSEVAQRVELCFFDEAGRETRRKEAGAVRERPLRFLVLFFVRRQEPRRRTKRLAIVEQRQVAHVQCERAPGTFLVDYDRHRTAFHAFPEADAATAGQARVREPLQHDVIIPQA